MCVKIFDLICGARDQFAITALAILQKGTWTSRWKLGPMVRIDGL